MRRFAVVGVAVSIGVLAFAPSGVAASARVAALQIGLRAHGLDPGPVDGVRGPMTSSAVVAFQRKHGIRATGGWVARRGELLAAAGDRCSASASSGSEQWDGTSQCSSSGCVVTASAGAPSTGGSHADGRCAAPLPASTRSRSRRDRRSQDVPLACGPQVGAGRLARRPAGRELLLDLRALSREPLAPRAEEPDPADDRHRAEPASRAPKGSAPDRTDARRPSGESGSVRSALDYWARVYGVDPSLARALAWMESGFQQDVISNVGAIGVMQLLPETWEFVDLVLLGTRTPRNYRATSGRVFATSAGSSTSSAAIGGWHSPAGTRARGPCASADCSTTRSSSSASCSRCTAQFEEASRPLAPRAHQLVQRMGAGIEHVLRLLGAGDREAWLGRAGRPGRAVTPGPSRCARARPCRP